MIAAPATTRTSAAIATMSRIVPVEEPPPESLAGDVLRADEVGAARASSVGPAVAVALASRGARPTDWRQPFSKPSWSNP